MLAIVDFLFSLIFTSLIFTSLIFTSCLFKGGDSFCQKATRGLGLFEGEGLV